MLGELAALSTIHGVSDDKANMDPDDEPTKEREKELAYEERQREKLRTLTREVGVNVLANLIAAAIIYLLAVLTGLLPTTPAAAVIASFVVLACFLLVTHLNGKYHKRLAHPGRVHGYIYAGAVIIGGLLLTVFQLVDWKLEIGSFIVLLCSLALTAVGLWIAYITFVYADK